MAPYTKKQLGVLLTFLIFYALLVFIAYTFLPPEQLRAPMQTAPATVTTTPRWRTGLVQGGMVFIMFAPLGLAGYWFARQLGFPPIYRESAGWRRWFLWPMLLGLGVGVLLIVIDRLFVAWGAPMIPHPPFPFSLIASVSAAIGEEIIFRSFLMGLCAFLLNLLLKRRQATQAALWGGNIIAALLFGAGHLPAALMFLGVSSPLEIPPLILAEVFLIGGLVSLVAGERYIRDGLVAAIGVHFWTDIVWHVIYPLIGG